MRQSDLVDPAVPATIETLPEAQVEPVEEIDDETRGDKKGDKNKGKPHKPARPNALPKGEIIKPTTPKPLPAPATKPPPPPPPPKTTTPFPPPTTKPPPPPHKPAHFNKPTAPPKHEFYPYQQQYANFPQPPPTEYIQPPQHEFNQQYFEPSADFEEPQYGYRHDHGHTQHSHARYYICDVLVRFLLHTLIMLFRM